MLLAVLLEKTLESPLDCKENQPVHPIGDQSWVFIGRKEESESEVAQSCATPSDPMDCSLPCSSIHGIFQARVLEWGAIAPGSSVHGILQARILEWVAIPFSRRYYQPRDQTPVSCIAAGIFFNV